MKKKLRVGILLGGRSVEHEVSLVSAASVMNGLNKEKYEILPIGITPEGRWLSAPDAVGLLKSRNASDDLPEHLILPDPRKQGLVEIGDGAKGTVQGIDVIFPILHGTFGEDGTVQGLLELADVPYVGAGVLGSAVGMDKVIQKQVLESAKIRVAQFVAFSTFEYETDSQKLIERIETELEYPCFVKPANTGSSIGISKAHDRRELEEAIVLAAEYDRKVLVERSVEKAREIECAVLGNDKPAASTLGEIIPSNEFYDYDAKYVDGKSSANIPADLPKWAVRKIQYIACKAFKILDCAGMARVDFLVQGNGSKIFLNEINTIPGFTSISMFPKLWEASGISYPELLDRLIELAIERHSAKSKLKRTYSPKRDWYKG
ncbi:MAG TPA: D-alanine--D-alanine ligase family protein [Bacteroidota bacterium]|nr:D-alanine--D-alanine ligase family protein [Bacteroidota bacterium]